jgi:hypothetical protein
MEELAEMKLFRSATALLVAFSLMAVCAPAVRAEQGNAESITITIDRMVMPQSVFHPGRACTKPATVTVSDFVIRNYSGAPIDGFIVQTVSGQTKVPIDDVKEINFSGWTHRRTEDIDLIENVTRAEMVLTDGTSKSVILNADFGTIEGKTEKGDFFLDLPHTVERLVFNR